MPYESHTRDTLRQAYIDAWRKREAGMVLNSIEIMIVEVIEVHPEYQRLLQSSAASMADFSSPQGAENPFLHMGLHIAVREQIAIDRPPGVRELHRRLQARLTDAHRAEHQLMEALAETLWEAQRVGSAPDETHYLQLARRRIPGGAST